jgi:hypothetical protein
MDRQRARRLARRAGRVPPRDTQPGPRAASSTSTATADGLRRLLIPAGRRHRDAVGRCSTSPRCRPSRSAPSRRRGPASRPALLAPTRRDAPADGLRAGLLEAVPKDALAYLGVNGISEPLAAERLGSGGTDAGRRRPLLEACAASSTASPGAPANGPPRPPAPGDGDRPRAATPAPILAPYPDLDEGPRARRCAACEAAAGQAPDAPRGAAPAGGPRTSAAERAARRWPPRSARRCPTRSSTGAS